jgi:hypothetical protein
MARMCLNNRMVLRTNRMQDIGPAHQAQNHRNCRKTENGSQQFSCRVNAETESELGFFQKLHVGVQAAQIYLE